MFENAAKLCPGGRKLPYVNRVHKGCVKCSRLVLSGYGTFHFFLEQGSLMNQSRAWFRAVLEVNCPKPKTACDSVNIFLP